jgi:hypothetical protein
MLQASIESRYVLLFIVERHYDGILRHIASIDAMSIGNV